MRPEKAQGYRWIVLFVYSLVMMMQQVVFITYASITPLAADEFGVVEFQVVKLSMIYYLTTIVFSVPAGWIVDKFGFHKCVLIGAFCTGIFGLLRGIFATDYNMVLILSFFASLGGPFMLTPIARLANNWFSENERVTAISLGLVSVNLGIIIGLVLTPTLVQAYGFCNMTLIYGVLSFVSMIPYAMLSREYPSGRLTRKEEVNQSHFYQNFKRLIRNKNYLVLLFMNLIMSGIYFSITSYISIILAGTGLTASQIGIVGGVFIISTTVAYPIWGFLSDASGRRLNFILLSLMMAGPALLFFNYVSSYLLFIAGAAVYGFFTGGMGSIAVTFTSEIAKPVSEGISIAYYMMVGQIGTIIFLYLFDYIQSATGSTTNTLNTLSLSAFVVFVICGILLKEPRLDDMRLKMEGKSE
jgi:MFS family permease